MNPPPTDESFSQADRLSSELLWTVSQLSGPAVDPQIRRRTAEMLAVVISGLLHHLDQLVQPTTPPHP